MTTILAVDTSTEACSVALQIGSECIAKYSDEPRSHSRLLMPMVQQVLAEADIKVNQLDAIGVSIGPGSFTGLRIGFAAVQGMAYGADIPVVPVSTSRINGSNLCASRKCAGWGNSRITGCANVRV